MKYTKQEVLKGIEKFGLWYQKIDFPIYNISTTDRDSWVMFDAASDNQYGSMTSEEASRLRPQPKMQRIHDFIKPYIQSQNVLEVGCAQGAYSIEFAHMNAKYVTGIDQSAAWIDSANFAKNVLELENVEFRNLDIFDIVDEKSPFKNDHNGNDEYRLPQIDTVFCSSALCHFVYPMAGLHKMVELADKYFILDDGYAGSPDGLHAPTTTLYWAENQCGNTWGSSLRLFVKFLWRVGYSPSAMSFFFYPGKDDVKGPQRLCLVLDKTKDQTFVTDEDRELWGGGGW